MNRAKIDRRIYEEVQRGGLMGAWMVHFLSKVKRAAKWDQQGLCSTPDVGNEPAGYK